MNEETMSVELETEGFEGFDESDSLVPDDLFEEETESETPETVETESKHEEAPVVDQHDDGESKPEEQQAQPEEAEQTFELNYMGNKSVVGRNEIIALAQKGMDYDRIKSRSDEIMPELESLRENKGKAEQYESFLSKLAARSNTDIQGLMDNIEAKIMVESGKAINEEIALERIKLEREKAAFESSKKASEQPKKEEKPVDPAADVKKSDVAEAKRQDEFIAFAKEYPDVKPTDIPKEVWADFNSGKSLVGAYSKYENKLLREKISTMEQEKNNKAKSTGSWDSAGAGTFEDPDFAGWE